MHLSFRSARPQELPLLFETMGEPFAYSPEIRAQVPALWSRWLRDGVLMAHVIERHGQGKVTPEAFGAMVFLRDGIVEAFRGLGRPYLRNELMRRALAGEEVVPTPDAMREANRGEGLTMLFLADPRGRRGMPDEHYRLIDTKWSEALYEVSGCRLKAIWHEVYGAHVMRHVAGCGLLLSEDWARHWSGRGTTREDWFRGCTY
jgi:hypothetical protein